MENILNLLNICMMSMVLLRGSNNVTKVWIFKTKKEEKPNIFTIFYFLTTMWP